MKNAVSTLTLVLVCLGLPVEAQVRTAPAPIRDAEPIVVPAPARRVNLENVEFKKNLLAVMDTMIRVYGEADMSSLVTYVESNASASPNDVVPFTALGHAYLNRYVSQGRNPNDLTRALDFFEIPARESLHKNWGNKWASSATATFSLMGVARLRFIHSGDAALDARISAFDSRMEALSTGEGDRRLGSDLPNQPYVSGTSTDKDSKSEENNWEALFLLWAARLYPGHPHAPLWETKGLELAKYSYVTPSEGLMLNGSPFSTLTDAFVVWNHQIEGDPWYSNAILSRMTALGHRMNGKPIPAEVLHNTQKVYNQYKSYCVKDATGRWIWNRPSDPAGDPSIFPVPGMGDDEFVRSVVRQKAVDGYLWLPTEPVTGKLVIDPALGFSQNSHLWRSIQNGKVVWYYLVAYLWYFPPIDSSN